MEHYKATTDLSRPNQHLSSMKAFRKTAAVCLMALTGTTMAEAQVPGSALDYMLQRPSVTKHFEGKKFGDHLFLDGGMGVNFMGTHSLKPGVTGAVNIGDWITPEHGMRLSFNGGLYKTHSVKAKFVGASLDYLLNITALAQSGAGYVRRPFEVYGIAGAGFAYSHNKKNTQHGLEAHIGLRGQLATSSYTYLYLEPRVGLVQDDISQVDTWHKFRPEADLSFGLGYRFPEGGRRHVQAADSARQHVRWIDGFFVSAMGGPLFFANSMPSSWKHNSGGRGAFSIGKWFGPYSALRLTGNATTLKQTGSKRVTAGGLQLDYLVNLHNAFGGINPSRHFWVNGVAGVSGNLSSVGDGRSLSLGVGGGLQANVRLSRSLDFFLEPRVDAYRTDYAPQLNTAGSWDVTAALLAGVTYTYHDRGAASRANDPFEQLTWHDHTFIEGGIGGNIPLNRHDRGSSLSSVRPQAYAAFGKWFTPLHGARLWSMLGQTEYNRDGATERYKHMSAGVDYLFNFTNAFFGYRLGRPFELTGGLGVGATYRQRHKALFLEADASLRGTWHVNPFLALFLEPRIQGVGDRFLPVKIGSAKFDAMASASAGVQFNMHGFNRAAAYQAMQESDEDLRSSFSVAGGLATQANHFRAHEFYGPVGRISYTQWYTPLSAWRLNMQGYLRGNIGGHKYGQVTAGADYMTDLTAQTYGYDPDRAVSINAFVGANIGVDYTNGTTTFSPDLHAGGQMMVRLSHNVRLFAEPQMSFRLSSRFKGQRLARWMPQMLFGLDYSLHRPEGGLGNISAPERKCFVSASFGTGVFTVNFNEMHPGRRKMSLVADASYGQWVNGLSGFHAGVGNTLARRAHGGNENITSLHVDYMMNLRTAVTGESTDDKLFQVTGLLGAGLYISSRESRKSQFVPGVQGAIQAGFRVSPKAEVYIEPSATVLPNKIEPNSHRHPVEGELNLAVGTKFYF